MTRNLGTDLVFCAAMILGMAAIVRAQEAPDTYDEAPAHLEPSPRPGRFRIGPLYWTPSFRIGTIGFDTNVFYTPTDRQADATASGGPALDLALPVRGSLRLAATGVLEYSYFFRTASERRLGGALSGGLYWGRDRTRFEAKETLQRSTTRPSYEVDRRVPVMTESTSIQLTRRLFGKTSLLVGGGRSHTEVDRGELFQGVDLRDSMTRDSYRGSVGLEYAFTFKTSLVVEGERRAERFLFQERRDADWDTVLSGVRTDATALISGHALVGRTWIRPRDGGPTEETTPVSVDATLNLSSKTHIGATYERNRSYSVLGMGVGLSTLRNESMGAHLDKDLWGRINLRLFVRRTRFHDEQPWSAIASEEIRTYRRDRADEAGADLGYRFRTRFRVGVMASYMERRSNIADFGVDGLLAGLSVNYEP
ncbi:MAG: hypothetical protein JXO72_12080 [Vicinamibacteria bacterium]|nr:hypothetical protein [Vicinamibacteria bacterium]